MPKKDIITIGKKKSATARVQIKAGKGVVRINSLPATTWGSFIENNLVYGPLYQAADVASTVDINVNVTGGGSVGQAAAVRVGIARALVAYTGDLKLREKLITYDNKILSGDARQREPNKPGDSSPRSRRQKSYR